MRNRCGLLAGLVVCLFALTPSFARALSLADVNDSSESYSAEGSNLSFSGFAVTVTGTRELDLSLIEIQFEPDGFRLVGPMVVRGTGTLDVVLDYAVSSTDRITAVELAFTGFAAGNASASIAETVDEYPEVALGVFDTRSGTLTHDDADLGEGASSLHITKDILLESVARRRHHEDQGNHYGWRRGHHHGWVGEVPPGWQQHDRDSGEDDGESEGDDCGGRSDCWCRWKRFLGNRPAVGIAHISVIEQRFRTQPNPIPEPSSVGLLGLGLGALVIARRRQRTAR